MPVHEKQLAERANAELLVASNDFTGMRKAFLDLLHEVLAQRDAQQQLYRVSHK